MSKYPHAFTLIAFVAFAVMALFVGGYIDPSVAVAGVIVADAAAVDLKMLDKAVKDAMAAVGENVKKVQDVADKALEEVRKNGTLHAETSKQLTALGEAGNTLAAQLKETRQNLLELEQKMAARAPGGDPQQRQSAGDIIVASDAYKRMITSGEFKMQKVGIPGARNTIGNATGQNQPLVPSDRLAGIVTPAQRRLTIRDLLPVVRTTSNLIEFCRELVFTNQAGPQYDSSSPTPHAEGAPKNESNITFELATSAVVTMAHWVGATKQVVADANGLVDYINSRLGYGLKLVEEDDLLNGDGTSGQLNGLINQATAFTGGATNQTRLDTILKAFLQVSLAEYEASGIVVHPGDWTEIRLAKDSQGRYLFSDPHSMEAPRVWGKPVVPTQSIALGTFLTGAFDLAAAIYDREDMNMRISDQHADFFIKNLLAILVEERLALVVYRPTAIITGSFNYAG